MNIMNATAYPFQITNTPKMNKQKQFYESSIETDAIFSLATCEHLNTPPSTPRKMTASSHENDITPPVKKTKRRDCTPVSPSKNDKPLSSSYFFLSTQLKPKSKFLEKIENCSDTIINDFDSKLRGAILLSQIDSYSSQINIMKVIIEDNELFAALTEQIISSFVEGFNTKSQAFFTFLIQQTALEIVNMQLGSFNESLKVLNDNVKGFEANPSSKQVEIDWNNNFFFLSVSGLAMLNGVNGARVEFVMSFKVNINQNRNAYFNSDSSATFKINEVICVDHIKIKIN